MASKLKPASFADPNVQQRRSWKLVDGKKPLHSFVNLYIYARNPAMYALVHRDDCVDELCVLRVSLKVLEKPGIYITDGNAADAETTFTKGLKGFENIDWEILLAPSWLPRDEGYEERKRIKCAEVLVPHRVEPEYIFGAWVASWRVKYKLEAMTPALPVDINSALFFQ